MYISSYEGVEQIMDVKKGSYSAAGIRGRGVERNYDSAEGSLNKVYKALNIFFIDKQNIHKKNKKSTMHRNLFTNKT